MLGQCVFQWRKVLLLALTAEDDRHLAAHPLQRGERGADVGAFGVVVVRNTVDRIDELDAVRQTGECGKCRQQACRLDADRFAQCERRHRVGRVVRADELHVAQRDQLLFAAHDPAVDQAVVAGALRRIQTKTHALASDECVKLACVEGIIAIEDENALALEDARLGRGVLGHAGVAIEMVLAHIENGRRVGSQRVRRFQLEAGEFEHPDGGCGRKSIDTLLDRHQRIERRRRDVAARDGGHAGRIQHVCRQCSRRRLAVATGDRNDLRRWSQLANAPSEQFDLGHDRHTTHQRRLDRRFLHRDARRDGDQVDASKDFVGERSADDLRRRHGAQ